MRVFFPKSRKEPLFVTLGEDCEKGLVLLQGLAMGLRGNREDGVENMFVESPWWILALKTTFAKLYTIV